MANLAVWQRTIVDPQGNVLPGAEVEVRHADTAELADIYLDREGEQSAPNPITANSDGFVRFYAPGGAYRVEASDGGLVAVWNFVAVGRLAESDVIEAEQFSSDAESHQKIRTKLDLVAASSEEMQSIRASVDNADFSMAFADSVGNVAAGFDEQGRFIARIGQQVESFEVGTDHRFVWAVTDGHGQVSLGVDKEGKTAASGLSLPGIDMVRGSSPDMTFAIADDQGRVAFGVYRDGTTTAGGEHSGPITCNVFLSFAEPIDDPSEELFLTWLADSADARVVEYRPKGGSAWMSASSFRSRPFPETDGRWLHTAALRNLSPDTVYEHRVPGSLYLDTVKTCPAMGSMRVVLASDWQRRGGNWYGPTSPLRVLGDVSTSKEPDLLIFNGDFNDSNGAYSEEWAQDYLTILSVFHTHWRGSGGAQIPIVPIMGNHEAAAAVGEGSASSGGDGVPGMIVDIYSWTYTPYHNTAFNRSVSTVRVRDLAAFIALETDHTVPIMDQLDWYKGQLDEHCAEVAHAFTVGHVPPFHPVGGGYTSSRARNVRANFWTEAQERAGAGGSMRAWLAAHTHQAILTPPLRIAYDPGQTDAENDNNFYRDSDGIVMIGCGSVGAVQYAFNPVDMARVSNIDGNPWWLAAIARTESSAEEYEIFGNVLNPRSPIYNLWIIDIEQGGGWRADCLNLDGDLFFSHDDME